MGAANLAFAVLSLVALANVRKQVVVRLAGAVLLTFNVLHFIYHMTMLHMYEPVDQVLNVIAGESRQRMGAAAPVRGQIWV